MLFSPVMTILGWCLSMLAALMVVPGLLSLAEQGVGTASAFFGAAIITMFLGIGLIFATRMETTSLGRRETFLAAILVWTIVPGFAALPFILSGALPDFINAYFEALSGFTTNGASVMGNLPDQPKSILLWRSLTQWVGGFAIIIFVSSLASTFNMPGNNPLNRAIAKSSRRRLSRRVRDAVLSLLRIYALLTAICFALLWLSGMPFFHALCYAFSTISTGGFMVTPVEAAEFGNRFTETVLIIFMVIGAINFTLHWSYFNGNRRSYFTNPEYRYLMLVVVFGSLGLFMLLSVETDMSALDSIRIAIFNTVSALTTTGYTLPPLSESGEIYWPVGILFALLFLMTIGGSSCSTAGGVKLMRVLLLFKQSGAEIKRLSFPNGVIVLKYGDISLTREHILSAWGFFTVYCFTIVIVASGLALYDLNFQAALSLAVSNIANAGAVIDPTLTGLNSSGMDFTSYGSLPDGAKLLLCIAMLVGRLEFFAILSLFNPALWRR
ncbi:TrkH family potassium uptake protein [Sneathiella chinensis]|uniref:Trk system potassium transporter TrkH n=1 Tax=Sneathiella chinensis TaxID=349750 RepID=A0ABQ5U759_9PROT|nr:TrkH family potassium uptake protein [Sneathiella chinensis]GLQ07251.1 Trk system potassium transporter TrkH [Sneathiella chinensis]